MPNLPPQETSPVEPGQQLAPLIESLAQQGPLARAALWEQARQAAAKGLDFREQLLKAGQIKEDDYQKALAQCLSLDFVPQLPECSPALRQKLTEKIPIRILKKHLFFPYGLEEGCLLVACQKPWPLPWAEEIKMLLGAVDLKLALSSQREILEMINQVYDRNASSAEEAAEVLEEDQSFKDLAHFSSEDAEDLLDAQDEEPIKKLMNSILFQSVKDGASDVHIDPGPKETQVRNRVDGVLHLVTKVPRQGHVPLLNRVKVMAGLDISTKNQPQDGRSMILLAGKKIDIRVSIIPTIHGERGVLRLLNQSDSVGRLEDLGLNGKILSNLKQIIRQPHGILLVTGPTGSGKTTSLYSLLAQIDAREKNIVTIEDPVEYRIGDYGQMQVNEKIGVTFAKGLRAMLRQDPDVIMVGEMRDGETAQIAIQASLTGHLVLSTLHTNDAASSMIRLVDMGIEPFLVTSTLSGVLAQRLVRKICPHCKAEQPTSREELLRLDFPPELLEGYQGKLYKGKGCEACYQTGYAGRLGVYELLLMNDQIRQVIMEGGDASKVRETARTQGQKAIGWDAKAKVIQGKTTLDEMARVVFTESEI